MSNPPLNPAPFSRWTLCDKAAQRQSTMRTIKPLLVMCLAVFVTCSSSLAASLCKQSEVVIWSCRAGGKLYSLCASRDLNRKNGYLEYRAGKLNFIEFRFPAPGVRPSEAFHFGLLAHGAALSFENGPYAYDISEDLIGEPVVSVRSPVGSTSFTCDSSTHSLTLTTTMNLFESIGVGRKEAE